MVESNENNSLTENNEENLQTTRQEKMKEEKTSDELKESSKTSADIEKEKKQFNSGNMNVSDNQAENLFTIQNAIINGGVSLSGYAVREVLQNTGKVDKDYDLSDAKQFAEFGEAVKAGEHFAVAVILCVFEYVELDDLQELKSKLLAELPKVTDEEGKEIAVSQNAYLSINHLLQAVNGEMVILESGEQCISLGTYRRHALKNLWQQFPETRACIARWLLNICDSFEFRTNFDAAQIAAAFINILKLDFNAGVHHFFPRFYSNSDKYWLLGFISLELYNDPDYQDKILPHIIKWLESSSSWLWKPALYVYANIENIEENHKLNKKVRESLSSRCKQFENDDLRNESLSYLAMLLIASERLRTLVASIFGDLMNNTHNYRKKRIYCLCYLALLRYGYFLVSSKMTALPLVVCDNRKQLENLLPLVETAFSRYDTRRMLFITLESYLKEISRYSVGKKTVNRMKAFFQLIAHSSSQFRNDIALFLRKCDCSLAMDLEKFLNEIFPSKALPSLSVPGLKEK